MSKSSKLVIHTSKRLEKKNTKLVDRRFKGIEAKMTAERKREGALKYDLRQKLVKSQMTVNYGKLYDI